MDKGELQMAEKTLYEVEEVLKKNGGPLPMSKAGIYLACSKGAIPTVRVGRRLFIPSWWVDEMINKPIDNPNKGA